ncbi:MAG: PH domain-containing protein [Pseudomonadota bacterium]
MAGYVESTLALGEHIIMRANFNWTYSFFPVLWFALSVAPLVMLGLIQYAAGVPYVDLQVAWLFAAVGIGCGFLILINHLILLWTTEIVVTSFRFVYKTGLISRSAQEVSLNKIEEINLAQSIWGRLFGYGQLILRGTGVGVIELPNLDSPITVRRSIENAKADLRRESSDERSRYDDDDE